MGLIIIAFGERLGEDAKQSVGGIRGCGDGAGGFVHSRGLRRDVLNLFFCFFLAYFIGISYIVIYLIIFIQK
jgi:hypothetical protein